MYAKDNEENDRWYLRTTKTSGSKRKVYICDSLYTVLIDYKNIQNNLKKQCGKKYKRYEYKIVKCCSKNNRVEMVFTRKDGTYSGTDIIRYPFKIINHELGINCRLRGSFATKALKMEMK